MEKVIMTTAKTVRGYSCSCDLLKGWVVAYTGDFDGFREYVRKIVDFYVEAAQEDGNSYPAVFDGDYEMEFKFEVQSLLEHYRGIFSFSALQR